MDPKPLPEGSRRILDATGISTSLQHIARTILNKSLDAPFAVVGIRRGGEPLARRLAGYMQSRSGVAPALGTVDITLYRDDGFGPREWPDVGKTDIPFDPRMYTVILVDDVLYTGRTVRAALDAILDYGRPKAIRLVVLVDRGLRELPIGADVAGIQANLPAHERVEVCLTEMGFAEDAVVVVPVQKAGK